MNTLSTLVCQRDLTMALETLPRMIAAWGGEWRIEVWDDGSLDAEDWARVESALPGCQMRPRGTWHGETEARLARHPATLRRFRASPLAIKLTAIPMQHARETLYYADPDVVLKQRVDGWWPEQGLPVVQDERRVWLANELRHWWGRLRVPLARRVNSGLLRMPPGIWDLDKIEWFVSRGQPFRHDALWEQTCWAFLLAGHAHVRLAPSTVWCSYDGDPLTTRAPAVHLIAHHKRVAARLLGEAFQTQPVQARFLRGSDGKLGYQLLCELDRLRYEIGQRWQRAVPAS